MKRIMKILFSIIVLIILICAVFLGIMTIFEYRPKDVERLGINNPLQYSKTLKTDEIIKISTFNIGYASLGKDQDFFLDGGQMIRPNNKKIVEDNLQGIINTIKKSDPDILLVQEIDEKAKRSYYINQLNIFRNTFNQNNVFTYNYKTLYVPIPIKSPLGKIYAGLYTTSKYEILNATRYKQYLAFSYPVRLFNLKRALLETRFKIENSDKELVVINLHIDAYVKKDIKDKQTKQLIDIIEEEYKKGNYVVAGGDFNQKISTDKEKIEIENFTTEFDKKKHSNRNLNDIYSKNIGLKTLDGFIISDNIEMKSIETFGNFEYSDHNLVEMQIILKK